MDASLDATVAKQLADCIRRLTRSGKAELDDALLLQFKQLVRSSSSYVDEAVRLLMRQLATKHAEVRLSALQLLDVLFMRSARTRELVNDALQKLLALVLNNPPKQQLPAPKAAATRLHGFALERLVEWHRLFGAAYPRLRLTYEYLLSQRDAALHLSDVATRMERQRVLCESEKMQRDAELEKSRDAARVDLADLRVELAPLFKEINTCLALLIPHPHDFYVQGTNVSSCTADSDDAAVGPSYSKSSSSRLHGYTDMTFTLEIEIPSSAAHLSNPVDYNDLLNALGDHKKLLCKQFLARLRNCASKLDQEEAALRDIRDLQNEIDLKLEQINKLQLSCDEVDKNNGAELDSDDDIMLDVPEKEGYEASVPSHLNCESNAAVLAKTSTLPSGEEACTSVSKCWQIRPKLTAEELKDPTSFEYNIAALGLQQDPDGPTREVGAPCRENVPVLPYGLDLAYWGREEEMVAPSIDRGESLHRFWRPPAANDDEKLSHGALDDFFTRRTTYTGEFVPVRWACRAPLAHSTGKLCQRHDRVKCPFHGRIIARNEFGEAVQQQDEVCKKVETEPRASARGKLKVGGLTKLRDLDSGRQRLEKRVFNKKSLERVAALLDTADEKKLKEKFANQYNYYT